MFRTLVTIFGDLVTFLGDLVTIIRDLVVPFFGGLATIFTDLATIVGKLVTIGRSFQKFGPLWHPGFWNSPSSYAIDNLEKALSYTKIMSFMSIP